MGASKLSFGGGLLRCIAISAMLAVPSLAGAEDFTQVLDRIAQDHPRVRSAQHLTRGGRAEVSAARSAYRPQFGVDTDIGWSGSNGAGGGIAILPEARISQLVYDGGRTPAEIRRRKIRVDMLGVQEQAVLADVSLQLAQAWIEHSRSSELVAVSEQQVAAMRELQGLVLAIASFDRGRRSDVVMVESRLQQAVTGLQSRQIALADARARIREVAALPVEPQGAIPDISVHLPHSAEDCLAWAGQAPAVRIADFQVAESEATERGVRNWWMPRLAVEGARTSEVDAQGDTRLLNDFAVRLRVTALPFDSGGGAATHEAARATLEAAQSNAELTRTGLRDQVQRLWVIQAQRTDRLPSLIDLVARSDEARSIVFEQFRIGRRSILDVLSYDLERFNARAQLVNERFDIARSQYELMGALGRIYPALVDPVQGQEDPAWQGAQLP